MASVKSDSQISATEIRSVVQTVQEASSASDRGRKDGRPSNHVLWVDDRPENNVNERAAFEAMGITFSLALSTGDALAQIENRSFAAIISDMGRKEGPREGYVLLDKIRAEGDQTPLFFYASSNAPEHKRETLAHGGQGCTNHPQELFQMVMRALLGS